MIEYTTNNISEKTRKLPLRETPTRAAEAKTRLPAYDFYVYRHFGNHRIPVTFKIRFFKNHDFSKMKIRDKDVIGPVEKAGIDPALFDREIVRVFKREKRQAEAMFFLLTTDENKALMEAEKAKKEEPLRKRSRELLAQMQEAKAGMEGASDDEKDYLKERIREMDDELHEITVCFVKLRKAFTIQNPWLVMMACTETIKQADVTHYFVKSVVKRLHAQLEELPDERCTSTKRRRLVLNALEVTLKYGDYKELLPLHLTTAKLTLKGREEIRKWAEKTGTRNFYSTTPKRDKQSWTGSAKNMCSPRDTAGSQRSRKTSAPLSPRS